MWKILSRVKKNLIPSILISMILGLVFGYYFNFAFLKRMILPLTIIMIYPMMVNIKIRELKTIENYKLHLFMLSVNFLIVPFVGYYVGKIFFPNDLGIMIGFFLMALLPTSGMTISWTGFGNGNVPEAIKMTVIGLLSGAFAIPIYINFFFKQAVQLSTISIVIQVFQVIFIPLIAGQLTRYLIIKNSGKEKYEKDLKGKIPLLSTIGLLLIIFISMALKAKSIISNPAFVISLIIPILFFYMITFGISSLLGRLFFERKDGITLVYGIALRNLSLAMGLAIALFSQYSSTMVLVISISYIFQVQMAAAYLKINRFLLCKGECLENA